MTLSRKLFVPLTVTSSISAASLQNPIHSVRPSITMNRERQWIIVLAENGLMSDPTNRIHLTQTPCSLSLTHFNSTPILTYGFTHSVPSSSWNQSELAFSLQLKTFMQLKCSRLHCRKQYSTHYSICIMHHYVCFNALQIATNVKCIVTFEDLFTSEIGCLSCFVCIYFLKV